MSSGRTGSGPESSETWVCAQKQAPAEVVRPGGLEPPSRSRPEPTPGISRPLCHLSYRRKEWSGQEDSNLRSRAPEARALARLSYTLMAARRGYDPLSPVRQTGRLARCVTGLASYGVHGASRTPTVMRSRRIPSAGWGTCTPSRQAGAPPGQRSPNLGVKSPALCQLS